MVMPGPRRGPGSFSGSPAVLAHRCMHWINEALGALAALLAATALGALWSIAGLGGAAPAAWMAPAVAVALAAVLRFNRHPPGASRSVWCVLLLLLTAAHANYLMSAGFIAGQMGLDLVDAIRMIGADMAFAVSRARLGPSDYLAYLLALAFALVLGYRQPGESTRKGKR